MPLLFTLGAGAYAWYHLFTTDYGEIPMTAPIYYPPQLALTFILVLLLVGSFIAGFMLSNAINTTPITNEDNLK